jgi:aspartate/methionine/tyrosine aminotransferase
LETKMQKGAFDTLPASPFTRLRALLDDVTPPREPVSLALGEPQHAPPSFALSAVSENIEQYRRYPPIAGTPDWQAAARGWLQRRFGVAACVSQAHQVLPLNGTREGLFLAAQIAPPKADGVMAMPDPFYQIYASAAVAAGAKPHYLAATPQTNFLPDLDALDADTLVRMRALYLCNPSNPQGAVADKAYLEKALALAMQHNFLLLADECYAEIYDPHQSPPPSILEVMEASGTPDAPVIAFHSLSKRSNLPGLRSGFAAGGDGAMHAFHDLRQIAGPQCPMPAQAAAALAWGDDTHVADNRARYAEKFDFAETVFSGSFDFYRPHAGFFLWLNVGDGAAAALHVWREEGLRVLPGGYLAAPHAAHAAPYIRVALVADMAVTQDALPRLKAALETFTQTATHGAA